VHFDDSRHPSPKHLTIDQRSYVSARLAHKDFVVIEYRIHNNDSLPLTGLYTGVACDFRTMGWNLNDAPTTRAPIRRGYLPTSSRTRQAKHWRWRAADLPHRMNGFANCINQATYIAMASPRPRRCSS